MVLPLILPALIGGAITGIGGALKASAQKRAQDEYLAEYAVYKQNVENTPQVTTNVTTGNLAQLVAASEAAGFNPVTVLRSGGLAYFNDTVTTAPKLWVPPAPREGFSPIGEFAQGFGQSVSSIDLSAMHANMAQAGLAQAQTLSLNQRAAGVAHIAAQRSGGGVSGTALLSASAGVARTPTIEAPTLTNPTPAGNWWWHSNPAWPDAAAWEDRFGDEAGGIVGGIVTALGDGVYNAARWGVAVGQSLRPYLRPPMLVNPAGVTATSRRPARPGQNIPMTRQLWGQ